MGACFPVVGSLAWLQSSVSQVFEFRQTLSQEEWVEMNSDLVRLFGLGQSDEIRVLRLIPASLIRAVLGIGGSSLRKQSPLQIRRAHHQPDLSHWSDQSSEWGHTT
jgi:hypothetical protein